MFNWDVLDQHPIVRLVGAKVKQLSHRRPFNHTRARYRVHTIRANAIAH
jgi:hypothetical protein